MAGASQSSSRAGVTFYKGLQEEMAQVVTWEISIDIRKSPGCNWVIRLFPILAVIYSFAFVPT